VGVPALIASEMVDHTLCPQIEGNLIGTVIGRARQAQAQWSQLPVRRRLLSIRKLRRLLAANAQHFTKLISPDLARTEADTLTAELLPLAEGARYLEKEAEKLLAPKRIGKAGRPFWLKSIEIETHHDPLGVVLIIGPGNYPLFLPGIQALQALAAGNAVMIKPGIGGTPVMVVLAELMLEAGFPSDLITVLDENPDTARAVIAGGVDKIVLTGSESSGKIVLSEAAQTVTPSIMELSGCDAIFVLHDADVKRAVDALVFGLKFNGSATCIAPRRVFVHTAIAVELREMLAEAVRDLPPVPVKPATASFLAELLDDAIAKGASTLFSSDRIGSTGIRPLVIVNASPDTRIMNSDVFAPAVAVMAVHSDAEALAASDQCPYALGASVFGQPATARQFARKVKAGVVVVNDIIVPTADPRLSFGGLRRSGFGKTRGAEGLLEMTVSKSVAVQKAERLRHLEPPHPRAQELFAGYLALVHGKGLLTRSRALGMICRAAVNKNQAWKGITNE
jgi:acyl-CoA reductase-like NAD-dependent aldehyde dehydrogenase